MEKTNKGIIVYKNGSTKNIEVNENSLFDTVYTLINNLKTDNNIKKIEYIIDKFPVITTINIKESAKNNNIKDLNLDYVYNNLNSYATEGPGSILERYNHQYYVKLYGLFKIEILSSILTDINSNNHIRIENLLQYSFEVNKMDKSAVFKFEGHLWNNTIMSLNSLAFFINVHKEFSPMYAGHLHLTDILNEKYFNKYEFLKKKFITHYKVSDKVAISKSVFEFLIDESWIDINNVSYVSHLIQSLGLPTSNTITDEIYIKIAKIIKKLYFIYSECTFEIPKTWKFSFTGIIDSICYYLINNEYLEISDLERLAPYMHIPSRNPLNLTSTHFNVNNKTLLLFATKDVIEDLHYFTIIKDELSASSLDHFILFINKIYEDSINSTHLSNKTFSHRISLLFESFISNNMNNGTFKLAVNLYKFIDVYLRLNGLLISSSDFLYNYIEVFDNVEDKDSIYYLCCIVELFNYSTDKLDNLVVDIIKRNNINSKTLDILKKQIFERKVLNE